MNVLAVTKGVVAVTSLATVAVMLFVSGLFFGPAPDDRIGKLVLFPFIAAWAIAPYFLAHRFALMSEGQEGWLLIAAIPIAAIPVLRFYLAASTAVETIVFVELPMFQALFVLAVYGATRLWRQFK